MFDYWLAKQRELHPRSPAQQVEAATDMLIGFLEYCLDYHISLDQVHEHFLIRHEWRQLVERQEDVLGMARILKLVSEEGGSIMDPTEATQVAGAETPTPETADDDTTAQPESELVGTAS